ncbi:MAG TPA: hydrolase [Bryobacterales bacterium]|nr:hydrolase [Bryobacterales bacterium]
MAPSAELLRPETTALLVIDLQEKLLPYIWERDRLLANVAKILRLAQILRLKTIPTTQYRKGLGATAPEVACLLPEDPMDKLSFGCLGDERIAKRLESEAPRSHTLLVAGIETHICVAQTVLGALNAGYKVHVAGDATSSRSASNVQVGLERMRAAGAVISSTEMAIYELLGRSDRAEFKQMLPYLK